jgi:hypothetical protein
VGQSWDRCREHRAKALERNPFTRLASAVSEHSTGSRPSSEYKPCDESSRRPPNPKKGHAGNGRRRPESRMTSLKQIEANRRNALQSSGPTSANGKHVSRRNALRHGLTAETVLEPVENPDEYRIFEAGDRRRVPAPDPGRAGARPSARFAVLAASPGNLDRNGAAADAGRDPSRLPELPPENARKARRGDS